ncbi:hypothetical protein AMEJIAPC_00573 [Caulobacter sp. NIBR1757]|nr:hypothetical protein AMEJIAPC_00573 [Caulobacter sp. NIBR1757]
MKGDVAGERTGLDGADIPVISPLPVKTLKVRLSIWRPLLFVTPAALLLVMIGLFVALAPELGVGGRKTWAKNADTLWTPTEAAKVADSGLFKGAEPGDGPPPFDAPADTGRGGVPKRPDGTTGRVRAAYERGRPVMWGLWEAWRASRSDDGLSYDLTADAEKSLHAALTQMSDEPPGRNPESFAVRYHLALAMFWRGEYEGADEVLSAARAGGAPACPDSQKAGGKSLEKLVGEEPRRRGLAIACFWLKGRIAFALERPQDAVRYLEIALTIANASRRDYVGAAGDPGKASPIISFSGDQHLISGSSGGLWRDYLVALLSQPTLPAWDRDGVSVRQLARKKNAFVEHPDLAALAKVVTLRQRRPGQVSTIVAPATEDAVLTRMASAADIVSGKEGAAFPIGYDDELTQQLRDWQAHNCQRADLLDGGKTQVCKAMSGDFAQWHNMSWRPEFNALHSGQAPWVYWVLLVLRWVVAAVLTILALLAFRVGLKAVHFRNRRYNEVFGSDHYLESLDVRRPRYEPPAEIPQKPKRKRAAPKPSSAKGRKL